MSTYENHGRKRSGSPDPGHYRAKCGCGIQRGNQYRGRFKGPAGKEAAQTAEGEEKEKQKLSAKLLDMISGIFAPVIPLITGAVDQGDPCDHGGSGTF